MNIVLDQNGDTGIDEIIYFSLYIAIVSMTIVLGVYNIYRLNKNKRFQNISLLAFYFFSQTTLIGKHQNLW